jgi:hypothetical protein
LFGPRLFACRLVGSEAQACEKASKSARKVGGPLAHNLAQIVDTNVFVLDGHLKRPTHGYAIVGPSDVMRVRRADQKLWYFCLVISRFREDVTTAILLIDEEVRLRQ